MEPYLKGFFTAILAILAINVSAQGTLRGYVYDREDESPIPFAGVKITGTEIGAITNIDGYYQINDVPTGSISLEVSAAGYQTGKRDVVIRQGRITTEQFYLDVSSELLEDVEVTADRVVRNTKVLTAVTSLSAKNIRNFSIGGEPDLVRAIQVLPGVVTTGDQGGQLYIRGGAPIQNLTLLDGMVLYNPFHSIGFFSVFDTDILRSAEVYSAGFNAQYGSRNSSVIDVRTRAGNRQRVAGKVSASTYMGKALLEVPIFAKDEEGFAPTSLLVSYKSSFLSQSSKVFYPYVETEYEGLPFEFEDFYGKFSYQAKGGSEVNLFGFSFNDQVRFSGGRSVGWNSIGYGVDFTVVPPASPTLIKGNLAISNYFIESNEIPDQPRNSTIDGFNGGLNFTYLIGRHDELNYGIEVVGYFTEFQYTNTVGRLLSQEQNTTEVAGYFRYKLTTGRFLIEPGIRLHYYSSLAEMRIEPRLGVKYNATDRLRFKLAAGMYSQNLVAANSDRDVVNLFYGFLSTPQETPASYRELDGKLQTSNHFVLGSELDLGKRWLIDVEGYIKDFGLITNVNRNKIYDNNEHYQDKPEITRKNYIAERGTAYGADLLVKYNDGTWSFWGTYSWSKVIRDDGLVAYAPHFDRRHNTNLLGSYRFGKDNNWEFNARWNFGSGFPFTPIAGYYQLLPFTDEFNNPDIDYPYTTQNGDIGTLYGEINSKRLPTYHRFDITVTRTWKLARHSELEIALAVTNVYNRENIFYYDTKQRERVNQLPIMPTLIASYRF